ncbi:hypothetical protein [Halomonas denitrificans]|nr:hypothetical protein [Halomonas denitrificans]
MVLIGLIVLFLLLAPGLLGLVAHRQIDGWLDENWPDASVRWQRGWMSSRVEAADADRQVALDLHHPPLDGRGLLRAAGPVRLDDPDTQSELDLGVDAVIDWALDLHVDVRSDAVERRDTVSVDAAPAQLAFTRTRDGAVDLRLAGDRLELHRTGAALALREVELHLGTDGQDPGRATLDLRTRREGTTTASRLNLEIEGIAAERAAAWTEALFAALDAPPGSTSASLAWVGVASAWEQLARAGLSIRLMPLALDGRAELTGQWHPADKDLVLDGGGEVSAVRAWLVPIFALATGESVVALREEFALQVDALDAQPGVEVDGTRFRVRWPPADAR